MPNWGTQNMIQAPQDQQQGNWLRQIAGAAGRANWNPTQVNPSGQFSNGQFNSGVNLPTPSPSSSAVANFVNNPAAVAPVAPAAPGVPISRPAPNPTNDAQTPYQHAPGNPTWYTGPMTGDYAPQPVVDPLAQYRPGGAGAGQLNPQAILAQMAASLRPG